MLNNRPTQPQTTDIAPTSSIETHWPQAQVVANLIVKEIVSDAQQILKRNAFLAKNLLNYSSQKTVKNMNEVGSLFDIMAFAGLTHKQQQEPNPLYVDSLLPISADIDPENEYKLRLARMNTLGQSNIKMRNKGKQSRLQPKEPEYIRLNLPEEPQEDGFTKELRKQQEQKHAKVEGEKKAKQKIERARLEKEKNKKKEEKISYDYNGQVVEVRAQNKANLISSIINGDTNSKTNLIKEAINDPNPTTLEGTNPAKARNKKFMDLVANSTTKKRDQVEFSDVRSLADSYRNTTYGVKYTYQGKTIEEKKKTITTKQLKKTLSQRRLSKDQFKMLQRLNGNNRQQFEDSLRKSTIKVTEQKLRSQSQAKLQEPRSRKTTQFIHVTSDNLKNKLLQKVRPEQPTHKKTESEVKEDWQLKLDSIDRFNMKYMTTGGSMQSSTSRQFYSKGLGQLPKIPHTTLYSHNKPKGRERIKDAGEIFREMRKRFEDKLRV